MVVQPHPIVANLAQVLPQVCSGNPRSSFMNRAMPCTTHQMLVVIGADSLSVLLISKMVLRGEYTTVILQETWCVDGV